MFWSLFLPLLGTSLQPEISRRKAHRSPSRSSRQRTLLVESLEDRYLLSGGIANSAIPTDHNGPYGIAAGPDSNVWFTERPSLSQNSIGKITPTGNVTLCPIPTTNSRAENITTGSDGNLWFTDYGTNSIGQVTPTGCNFDQFPIPMSGSTPEGITAGPDGNVWFAEYYGHKVGRITPAGSITEFTPPTANSRPSYITAGPDGNLWFTEAAGNRIGRINLLNTPIDITEFLIPSSNSNPDGITLGPDGNLWFTEQNTNQIGRISPFGSDQEIQDSIHEFTVPAVFDHLYSITPGPDGNLWFVGWSDTSNKIGRMTPDGLVTYTVPANNAQLVEITVGSDGNLWFTEYGSNSIGKLYVLTASGLTLGNVLKAGQPLDAVVATFHDDEPGMLGSNYQVDIDWGDGTSGGQAWTTGGGNWVATGSHTYAEPGHYDIAVTITDTHAPTGMTATTYSSVDIDPAAGSGNTGHRSGFEAFADVASALASLVNGSSFSVPLIPGGGRLLPDAPDAGVRQVDHSIWTIPASPAIAIGNANNASPSQARDPIVRFGLGESLSPVLLDLLASNLGS